MTARFGRRTADPIRSRAARDEHVVKLMKRVRDGVVRKLSSKGKGPDADGLGGGVGELTKSETDEQLLLEPGSNAVLGRSAQGERDLHAGRGRREEPLLKAPLCAELNGWLQQDLL